MNTTKVYLVNPPFYRNFVRCGRWQGVRARGRTLNYPVWLAYSAAVLEDRFVDVRLADAVASEWSREVAIQDICRYKPDVVIVDTNFSCYRSDTRFGVDAKRGLDGKPVVVVVGPPAAVFDEEILVSLGADVVARKEYDYTILELVNSIQRNRPFNEILGISYKEGGNVVRNPDRPFLNSDELDKIPFVSQTYRRHLDPNDYWLDHAKFPMIQIITSRGCPNQCTFCSWPENLHGHRFRARSAQNVVDEIEWVCNNMPEIKEVFFEDDSFTIDKKRVFEIAGNMKERGLEMPWSCQSRPTLDLATMKVMRGAGCRLLDVGFESGNDDILRNIKKGFDTRTTMEFARNARKAGLMLLADFVFGFPGETKATICQTTRFIREIKPSLLQIAIATPLPGTDFHRSSRENGYLLTDDPEKLIGGNGFQRCVISYPNLSSTELEKAVTSALNGYYLTPRYIPTAIRNVVLGKGPNVLVAMMKSAIAFVVQLENNGQPRDEVICQEE